MLVLPALLASIAVSATTPSSRKTAIAVMPVETRALDADAVDVLTSTLSTELVNTGTVRVMERSQMEKILQEQGFQKSGACDGSECAVEIGKILTVDRIVLGNVGRFGNAYSLSLRMVDVQSGEVLRSVSKNIEGPPEAILTRLAPVAVRELLDLQPPPPKRDLRLVYSGKKGKFKDPRDDKSYPWIRIGNQIWMTRNLDRDTAGGHCYENRPERCDTYGRLYDWNTAQRICPQDWHLPSRAEWDTLIQRAGGITKAAATLKDWRSWDGTDDLGFRMLPAGEYRSGTFSSIEGATRFWSSSTITNGTRPLSVFIQTASERVFMYDEDASYGSSVRCVLDGTDI
jgi:uncharacterized protein (TIGR02145 family)